MAKKAKVGSAAKSSPFTKPAAVEKAVVADSAASTASSNNVESSVILPAVAEDEVPKASFSKPAEPTSESKQNVVVCVRMRPSRASTSDAPVWSCDSTKNQIVPTEHHPAIAKRTTSSERAGAGASIAAAAPSTTNEVDDDPTSSSSTYHFQFDKLITAPQTTDDMYHSHIAPVVRAAIEGFNGTVFAYGQTGSGKTHTMSGSDAEPGVIPRAVQQVFHMINDEPDREFLLRVSYLEIYNETLKDLLAPLPQLSGSMQTTERPASPIKGGAGSTLRIIEDQKSSRVIITGLREEIVTDAETVLDLLQRGQDERHVGATDWNERSSRSHCVFQLTIESRSRDAAKEVRISQLNLIDLAGSERAASQAERRKEGAYINKSLLTLGTVIGKLTEPSDSGDAHIPYRDSKLTRILQTSLSGNARIAVICTLSPDTEHANETLSTLKFGKRCKLVVTTAKRGTAMDDKALLQKYRKELDALRAKLEANGSPNTDTSPQASRESQSKLDELQQQRQAAQKEVDDMQKKRSDLKGQIEHLTRLILTGQSVAADASDVAGPSTPVRARYASALARRGPRMSDLHLAGSGYNSPIAPTPAVTASDTLSGVKPFELEAELAALRRQLRTQIESRQSVLVAHQAELAARDARQAELEEAIRLNEQELDEAEVAYEKLEKERDEARKIALKEQEKARENKKKLLEEQEANRLLKLVAKARADDEGKVLERQIEQLTERLRDKESEVESVKERLGREIAEVKASVEDEKTKRIEAERAAEEAQKSKQAMQIELEEALASVEELKEQQVTSTKDDDDDGDDVNAEFQDLVRGSSQQHSETLVQLQQRESELQERQVELDQLRLELDSTRRQLAESQSLPDASRQLATLRDELGQCEEERQTLSVELAKVRAAASGRERDAQRLTAIEAELKRANAKIAELEAEKAKEAEIKVARPLPVPMGAGTGGSVASSPVKFATVGGSKLRPTTASNGSTLHRAGSVKEYRRYAATTDSCPTTPSATCAPGSQSVMLPSQAFPSPDTRSTAEKQEIDRLNAVIASQRALMADLENSVASWKLRMKAQAELIHKLASNPTPPTSDGETEDAFSSPSKFNTLPRTTHLSLQADPYYGAHTFNRPPSVAAASPTKFANHGRGSWTTACPSPLPLPGGADASPSKRKPRKTIEMDLKLLKSSPRVESSKSKFSTASLPGETHDTPTKRRGTTASAYYI